jgi:hypothetical protein
MSRYLESKWSWDIDAEVVFKFVDECFARNFVVLI